MVASTVSAQFVQLTEGLELPVQLLYLIILLSLLITSVYLIYFRVMMLRELDMATKTLGEKVMKDYGSVTDSFELGAVLVRKKLYTQAVRNLEYCVKNWDREEMELAQVYNVLGFAYVKLDRIDQAIRVFREAVKLQPGYIIVWNNLGDAFEKKDDYRNALSCYNETLIYDNENIVALRRKRECEKQLEKQKLEKGQS